MWYREKSGRWCARIGGLLGPKKKTHLGTFETGEEAAEAYDRAAIILRGRDAVTNFNLDEYGELLAQVERASPEERRAMRERLTQRKKEKPGPKPKPKASKLRNLGAPRAGGVQKKRKGKAKAKHSAGSPAGKPKPEPKPEPEEVEILKLEPKPEPEEVEIC